MGETEPRRPRSRRDWPFGSDWKEAFLAIHLARPLLGQRSADLLSVLEGLKAERTATRAGFHLVGVGAAGPVVLHAALLDDKGLIKEVTLERSLISWEDLVKQGISRDQLGNVVPGRLRVYDLPDLAVGAQSVSASARPWMRRESPFPTNSSGNSPELSHRTSSINERPRARVIAPGIKSPKRFSRGWLDRPYEHEVPASELCRPMRVRGTSEHFVGSPLACALCSYQPAYCALCRATRL